MGYTIGEIARALGAESFGDADLKVNGVAEPAAAGPEDLALAMKPEYAGGLGQGAARAAILWDGADWQGLGLTAAIVAPRPRMAMAGVTRMLDAGPGYSQGIHPTAIVDESAELAAEVSVGAFTIIGAGVRIGAGSVIGPQAYVGPGTVMGADTLLHNGARIGPRVTLGDRVTIHPGAAVGMDGFSFVTPEENAVEKARASLGDAGETQAQAWVRIHSLGAVEIGNDVEIGCNTCIDAGTVRPTRVGDGTKIDNLCHVAHNCEVGRDCLFAAMVGIAGSTTIGNNVVFGGQVGVTDNTSVGDGVVAGGASVILSKVPAGRVILGYPATKMETHLEMYKALRRLPRVLADMAGGNKAVSKTDKSD